MRRWRSAAAVVAVVCLLSACGIHRETTDPTLPSPPAAEAQREALVAGALEIATDATTAATLAAQTTVAAELVTIADAASVHVWALGGPYDPGPAWTTPSPTPSSGATTTAATPKAATAAEVLAELVAGRTAAARAADEATDTGTARLLAAIAVSRSLAADRLAAAMGVTVPPAAAPDPSADATPAAGPSPDAAAPTDPATASADRGTLLSLVTANDAAGYAMEVLAAKLDGDQRKAAQISAASHRATAEALATEAGVAGTPDDPRAAIWALPGDVDDAATVAQLPATVLGRTADTYAAAVTATAAGQRSRWISAWISAAAEAQAWGATPTALPAMPDVLASAPATLTTTAAG